MINKSNYEHNQTTLLIQIESFTKKIIDEGLEKEKLPELIRLLENFEYMYSCNHRYADYVDIFSKIALELERYGNLENGHITYSSILNINECQFKELSDSFALNKSKILDQLRLCKHRVKERRDNLKSKVEKQFEQYSRNLIVRVDLKYQVDKQQLVDIEMFSEHVHTLCSRMANKDKCFKNLRLYAWCLEQAPQGSYHIHLFLMYDGSKATYDIKLAKWVGEIWENEITAGLGCYWNCNYNKDKYDARTIKQGKEYLNGLGMIERSDPLGLAKLEAVYSYLAEATDDKLNQRLRVRMKGMRAFGCTQFK